MNTDPISIQYYIGPMEFILQSKDSRPRFDRINASWGYIKSPHASFANIKDYQGNVRAIANSYTGEVVQTTDYYPYGLPMATSTGADVNRYKYSGKELETRLGLNYHDFEARMLFNDITLFNRPDPKAIDYPGTNPYLYCSANPLRYIDPTGEDIWRINEKGEIAEFIETKEYDRIEFIDNNNNIVTDSEGNEQYLQFDYGTITHSKQSYSNVSSKNNGNMSGEFDVFKIDGDRNATSFFEMFAQNVTAKTGNEIGLIRTGKVGTGANYITSAQKKGTEPGGPVLFHSKLKNGYYIREITHSHKDVKRASSKDRLSHQQISTIYKHSNKIRYRIYVSTQNCFIQCYENDDPFGN